MIFDIKEYAGTYLFKDGSNVGWRSKTFGTPLGSKAVGSIIKIKVNNVDTDFIVAQHGRPSSSYDASFDGGTILVAKNSISNPVGSSYGVNWWANATDNTYYYWGANLVVGYLSSYYQTIDANIRSNIKTVNLPCGYISPDHAGTTMLGGYQNMAHTVFIPSAKELGYSDQELLNAMLYGQTYYEAQVLGDGGATWAYFQTGAMLATYDNMWTRTPGYYFYAHTSTIIYRVAFVQESTQYSGNRLHAGPIYVASLTNTVGRFNPAFVLPQTLLVNDGKYIMVNADASDSDQINNADLAVDETERIEP